MKRAVRTLLRLIAAALVVFGGMGLGLEFMRRRAQSAETSPWHYLAGSLLIVSGIILLAASSRVAARLTAGFDGDDDIPPPPSGP
jgi:hypothetical protein